MSFSPACIVVAGPSGVGKSTLIARALAQLPDWMLSISATTRGMREGEQHGVNYYFFNHGEFEKAIVNGGFLEFAQVYGNYYGTPVVEEQRAAREGRNMVFEVDTVGCLSIRAMRPHWPLVAIVPPELEELRRRLEGRGTESAESLALRLGNSVAELQRMRGFDYVIVNDDLERATAQLVELMSLVGAGLTEVGPTIDSLLGKAGGTKE
ncbi:MAG: guanylate kinase [bacterium]